MANRKIIGISGSRGFIGGVLIDYLEEREYTVLSYDCNFTILKEVEETFLKLGAPDVFIHLAGRFYGTNETLIKDNLLATNNILNVIEKFKSVKFIFSSTGAVYGNSGELPVNELKESMPNTYNGLVKHWCEQAVHYYQGISQNSSIILRFPSVYGESNNKGVIYHWLNSIKENKNILINGDGNQYRSFIHVLDICSAILCCIESVSSGTFNISNKEFYNLNELSLIFKKYFEFNIERAEKDNDLKSMVLDPSKFIKDYKWSPEYNIASYLKSIKLKEFN